MTTLTQTWGYTCRVCDKVASIIGGFFVSFHKSMIISRQINANTHLVKYVRNEYPGLSDEEILNELNYKTLRRVYDE